MSRSLWIVMSLMTAGCSVDETGYDDPDSGLEANDDPLASDAAAEAAAKALVHLTSEQPVGEAPGPVLVIGLPGAVVGAGLVQLTVNGAAPTPVVSAGDGFVGVVTASLGDRVGMRVGEQEVVEFPVTALVAADPGLAALAQAPPDETDTSGEAWPRQARDGSGIYVGDGEVPGVSAPYLVFNLTTGVSLRVEAGDLDAIFAVTPGDRACFAKVGEGGVVGTAVCFDA